MRSPSDRDPHAAANTPSASGYWSQRYSRGDDPWDLGVPSPLLEWALHRAPEPLLPRLGLEPDDEVLVPGCGRGYDLLPFARLGHPVVGIDFAAPAAAASSALLKRNGYAGDVICADLFGLGPGHHGRYQVIFDHTCLCALPRYLRNQYAENIHRWLVPGGFLVHVGFPDVPARPADEGPPYRLLRSDCEEVFGELLEGQTGYGWGPSHPERWGKERLDLWRKPQ